jgi:aflatoxin B1 aldehyde reductase
LYFHAPDTTVAWAEQLDAANELYKEGIFKRLGLSNYTAGQVQEVYDTAKSNGYVVPTVYQGNYSAVSRKPETILLPTLRKLGISYYVYSPIAGGFLAKTREQVEQGAGRFDKSTAIGKRYGDMYHKPSYLDALDKWGKISEDAGAAKAELAYRWVTYHSALSSELGDAVIFGARGAEQVTQTVASIRAGPLPTEIAERVNAIWKDIEHDAPFDNFDSNRASS